ncbi:MAG: hypothetical protein KDC14_01025 [Planctomycetes bacterium]|nr:hypothetical protein [Planctomycetota bacterium]
MAEIRTETFTTGSVVTTYTPPETVREWIERHTEALKNLTPDSNPLVTTWPIKDPPCTASTSTTRQSGQSDPQFINSHTTEYLLDMMDDNPDPS